VSTSFRWDLLVKVGGSLGRGRALPPLLGALASLARHRRVLVVPGGGRFAGLVREEMRRLGIGEEAAHRMALLGMDQYGLLLAALAPGAEAVPDLAAARWRARAGGLPILLASGMVMRAKGLERTFRLTSDSIAAHIAGRTRPRRFVLLKSVAGEAAPLAGRAGAARLARLGVVDPLFPALLPAPIETWVLDGRDPEALARFSPEGPRPARRSPAARRAAPPGTA